MHCVSISLILSVRNSMQCKKLLIGSGKTGGNKNALCQCWFCLTVSQEYNAMYNVSIGLVRQGENKCTVSVFILIFLTAVLDTCVRYNVSIGLPLHGQMHKI